MADDPIPTDVRDFLLKHIDSIAHLEALLLLRRTPETAWTAVAAARQLYVEEPEAAELLARLAAEGFASTAHGTFKYAHGGDDRQVIDRLADVYARLLMPVTNLIHAKPRRIREFADAFKLRKDS